MNIFVQAIHFESSWRARFASPLNKSEVFELIHLSSYLQRCRVSISRVGYRGVKLLLIALVAYGCVSLLINNYAYYHHYARIVATPSNDTGGLRQESPSQTVSGIKLICICIGLYILFQGSDKECSVPKDGSVRGGWEGWREGGKGEVKI